LFNFFVSALPYGNRTRQQGSPFVGEDENAAATVVRIGFDFDEAAALKRLQSGGQGGSIHGEQGSDGAHGRRLGTIERHEQGELPVGEFEGAQFLIETPGQGTCRTLHMETQTSVFDHESCFKGQRFCT